MAYDMTYYNKIIPLVTVPFDVYSCTKSPFDITYTVIVVTDVDPKGFF